MKQLFIASAIALSTGLAQAAPFAFERQFGSPDLDPTLGTPGVRFAPIEPSDFTPSVYAWYRGNPDVDVSASNGFTGTIVPSGPTRISLYEIYRGNPEGVAYRGYLERHPADTDWTAIAQEHRRGLHDGELAQKPTTDDTGS